MFIWIVKHTKGDFIAMIWAVDGRATHVFECIVHPAQVPFHIKAKTTIFQRMSDFRITGGILGYHNHSLILLMNHGVNPFDEVNCSMVKFVFLCLTSPIE